ncbi:hypothetical protein RA876_18295 [Rhodoferax antarcticus]|nr:hypothetical protein RA876_18295 [Rhodoferax antarcticus]
MRMIKEALRYNLELGHSLERCARALNISKGVVAKYVALAKAAALDWAQIAAMTEVDLQARLQQVKPKARQSAVQLATAQVCNGSNGSNARDAARCEGPIPTSGPFVQPDYAQMHRELSRKGMTLMLAMAIAPGQSPA